MHKGEVQTEGEIARQGEGGAGVTGGDNQVTRLHMGGVGGAGGAGKGVALKLNLAALSEPPDAVSGWAPGPRGDLPYISPISPLYLPDQVSGWAPGPRGDARPSSEPGRRARRHRDGARHRPAGEI